MKKNITKDCSSCPDLIINAAGEFECTWGNSKRRKILKSTNYKLQPCNLKRRS